MKSLLFVLSQLTLVTLVYAFAYRAGYRSAQSKAMSVVKKFADPVTCLLDQLNESVEQAADCQEENISGPNDEHRTSNIEHSISNKEHVEL